MEYKIYVKIYIYEEWNLLEFFNWYNLRRARKNVRPAVRMLDARADNNNNNNNNNNNKKKKKKKKKNKKNNNIQLYLSRVALDSIKY